MHRFNKCVYNPAGCKDHNIIILSRKNSIFSPWCTTDFEPLGKSMSINNGLIYFYQHGCCDGPGLVTAINGEGDIVKTCLISSINQPSPWKVTEKEWKSLYNCKQRRNEMYDHWNQYGNRDRKLRGQ
jgi:hypothetical protein